MNETILFIILSYTGFSYLVMFGWATNLLQNSYGKKYYPTLLGIGLIVFLILTAPISFPISWKFDIEPESNSKAWKKEE